MSQLIFKIHLNILKTCVRNRQQRRVGTVITTSTGSHNPRCW